MFQKTDLARLRRFEQAKDLSIALLKEWLVKHKFSDWHTHKNGAKVTHKEKEARAKAIGKDLSDNNKWHSHGRMIGMETLRDELRLKIDGYGENSSLQENIRRYHDILLRYMSINGVAFLLYNRHIIN